MFVSCQYFTYSKFCMTWLLIVTVSVKTVLIDTFSITRKTVVGYSLAPHTSLIMPFSGSTGTVVHVHGLTGSNKVICESRLGYLYPCAWCAWIVF